MSKKKFEIILLAVLLFCVLLLGMLFLFRVQEVTVSGNYHNTDAEVREMVLQGPLAFNSLYLKMANNHRKVESDGFIDSLHVRMEGMHKIHIDVHEKDLVGYVAHDDRFWYFDREGIVRISSEKDESAYANLMAAKELQETAASEVAEEAAESELVAETRPAGVFIIPAMRLQGLPLPMTGEAIVPEEVIIAPVEIVDEEGEAVTPEANAEAPVTEEATASEAAEEEEAPTETPAGASGMGVVDTEKHAGSYIPFVEGLEFSDLAVGEMLPVKNPEIFASLETLKVYVNKNKGVIPEHIRFDENWNLLLTYQECKVNVGSGNYVGRRLEQLGGIFSHIAGLSGTLHLENYDGSQERLIFTRE